jgi:nitroreductase
MALHGPAAGLEAVSGRHSAYPEDRAMTAANQIIPGDQRAALDTAARLALRAPSALNTQPWRWRVTDDALELRADRDRQLAASDPDGRLLMYSCGTALHHARTSLAADGYRILTERFPDPTDPDLLARVHVVGRQRPDAEAERLRDAIGRRRTDRRPFADTEVPAAALDRIRHAAENEETYLHVVRLDQLSMVAIATVNAAANELADPAYRAEVMSWTHRPRWIRDGVPPEAAVDQVPRRVPLRDHALAGGAGLRPGAGTDHGAAYCVLFGDTDDAAAWLRAGEGLSAVLLTAVAEGLSASPITDPIELTWPRQLLREVLGGVGQPYVVVRLGFPVESDAVPPVPRRAPADVIEHRP